MTRTGHVSQVATAVLFPISSRLEDEMKPPSATVTKWAAAAAAATTTTIATIGEAKVGNSATNANDKDNKYNINNEAFRKSVQHAEFLGRKGHLTYRDLPLPWRVNPFILTGYRFTPSLVACALSPLLFSNEFVNIWTHLVPVFVVLHYAFASSQGHVLMTDTDKTLAASYHAIAIAALLCSSAWHSFRCCSRVHVMSAFVSVDMMAISLILTAFSVITTHTAFYSQPGVRMAYISCCLVWCLAGTVLPWTDFFRPREVAPLKIKNGVLAGRLKGLARSWTRMVFFSLLGAHGVIIPAAHATALNGWEYTSRIFGLSAWVAAPIFLGSFVYAAKLPERWWPGRFDYAGNSHNIWHAATAISAIVGCEVMGSMFAIAREGGRWV